MDRGNRNGDDREEEEVVAWVFIFIFFNFCVMPASTGSLHYDGVLFIGLSGANMRLIQVGCSHKRSQSDSPTILPS